MNEEEPPEVNPPAQKTIDPPAPAGGHGAKTWPKIKSQLQKIDQIQDQVTQLSASLELDREQAAARRQARQQAVRDRLTRSADANPKNSDQQQKQDGKQIDDTPKENAPMARRQPRIRL